MKAALKKTDIAKAASVHTLRHYVESGIMVSVAQQAYCSG
jgi:hypothetical protein